MVIPLFGIYEIYNEHVRITKLIVLQKSVGNVGIIKVNMVFDLGIKTDKSIR